MESVENALAELERDHGFDLVLTDFNFPTSNGLEFCQQLNQRGYGIPVIFLTGVRDFKLAVDAMKLGVEDFILKEELSEARLPKTIVNVTERVRTRKKRDAVEKRLAMAETRAQAIKDLVVTVCHEFNNPLAAVKISLDLIERSVTQPADRSLLEEFERHFRTIEREIVRLRDLNFERFNPPRDESGNMLNS